MSVARIDAQSRHSAVPSFMVIAGTRPLPWVESLRFLCAQVLVTQ